MGVAAALLLAPLAVRAEHPAVEAAAANLWVSRPPPRDAAPDLKVIERRAHAGAAENRAAGVPGMTVTVEFPPDSAELDDAQRLALHMLTRELRDDPKVRLLWIRTGSYGVPFDEALAKKRAEALRRATGGKGFPWERIFLDTAPAACEAGDCDRIARRGVITAIEAR